MTREELISMGEQSKSQAELVVDNLVARIAQSERELAIVRADLEISRCREQTLLAEVARLQSE